MWICWKRRTAQRDSAGVFRGVRAPVKPIEKLIEDLIEASKASTGNLPVHLERLEAGIFMTQTVGEFEEKTKEAGLDLVIEKPETPVYIMADSRHFWRVIDNLMNNICKYAQSGTRVYINLEVKEAQVSITFRNTSKYPLNISSDELMERLCGAMHPEIRKEADSDFLSQTA